jgi:NTP pyrophosphatase (non-canonical NTP hydrolase)
MKTLREIQGEQRIWSEKCFGPHAAYRPLLGIAEEIGELADTGASPDHIAALVGALGKLAHSHLKEEQRIRGEDAKHFDDAKDAIGDIVIFILDYCNCRGLQLDFIVDRVWTEVSQRQWNAKDKGKML